MTTVTTSRTIQAPLDVVFRAVTDIAGLPDTNPDILRIEFLSEERSGVGTRFRETRSMNGREMETELLVTEFQSNESARMVADSHGTIWDSLFTVRPQGAGTELVIEMEARGQRLMPKLLNPLMKGLFKRGLVKHLDAVQAHCEGLAPH